MTSVRVLIGLLLVIRASFGTFVQDPNTAAIYYFSDTETTVNPEDYFTACKALPGGRSWAVSAADKAQAEFLFDSYSGDHGYLIYAIGPDVDGRFYDIRGAALEFNNFRNETAARSGDFGLVYIDFPNNWWKVAPLMAPRKMRYICETVNRCSYDPCRGYAGQCLVNSTSGWFYCDNNVTSCDEGDVCQNDGTCVDEADSYSCQCREPYSGKHCELYDHCWSNPCQHGGTCVGDWYRYHCKCADNFHGRVCEYGG